LQGAGSYPQRAQQLTVDCPASKDRVSGHQLYRRMRGAELSPAPMRLYPVGGWPVVKQFSLDMSQNLTRTRFAPPPGYGLA
ncbi:TenA family transcriptional regulator, partial [Pseudomonas aeruginosa]